MNQARVQIVERRKDGIALIITMGFLAVIAILAVSFAITMRVERLVARTHSDGVRARHMAHVALARVIDEIHTNARTGTWVYPTWTTWWSRSTLASNPGLLTPGASNYIPRAFLGAASTGALQARWVTVRDSNNRVVGRYACLVVDSSGFIDANLGYEPVTNVPPRTSGLTLDELVFHSSLTPEVKTPANLVLARSRDIPASAAFGRLETYAELTPLLAYGYSNAQPLHQPPFYPSHFFHFSYFPHGYWEQGTVKTPVYVGGPVSGLNEANIRQAFEGMPGIDATKAAVLAKNLLDFLDSDRDVRPPLDSISAEAVPMLNELVLENAVRVDGSTWHNEIRARVEVFYPFVHPNSSAQAYTVTLELRPEGGDFPSMAISQSITVPILSGPDGFHAGTFELFRWSVTTTNTPAMPTRLVIQKFEMGAVDQVVTPITLSWADHFHAIAIGATQPKGSSWAVDDPRINWDFALHWKEVSKGQTPPQHTLGSMNAGVVTFGQPGKDGSHIMYCRNEDNLRNVADIAFLLYDENRPWETIPLFGNNRLPILDRFTTAPGTFRRGVVHMSTRIPNVLATVFHDMPVERYPGEGGSSATRVGPAQAQDLANALIAARPGAGFTNRSEIGRMLLPAPFSGMDRLRQKSIIRNSCELLGTRQNIFTIIIRAQSGIDANNNGQIDDDEVAGNARAVTVVWRDPFIVNGYYQTFVRYLRWLEE